MAPIKMHLLSKLGFHAIVTLVCVDSLFLLGGRRYALCFPRKQHLHNSSYFLIFPVKMSTLLTALRPWHPSRWLGVSLMLYRKTVRVLIHTFSQEMPSKSFNWPTLPRTKCPAGHSRTRVAVVADPKWTVKEWTQCSSEEKTGSTA